MPYFDIVALIVGAGLIVSGILAVRRRRVNIPKEYVGARAVALGWVWVGMGVLFILGVACNCSAIKQLFRIFLQAAN